MSVSADRRGTAADVVTERLGSAGVVPVVVLEDVSRAAALMRALHAGGLSCAEITLRTPGALDAIAAAAEVPDVLVGAGTVLTAQQTRDAIAAGARFVVSPGLSLDVVTAARDAGVCAIPGVATASEAMTALAAGLTTVKFFPAGSSGGAPAVAALSAVFPGLRFMPTGGIGVGNLADYLGLPSVLAVGGSWLTPRPLVDAGDLAAVTDLARSAVRLARSLREP